MQLKHMECLTRLEALGSLPRAVPLDARRPFTESMTMKWLVASRQMRVLWCYPAMPARCICSSTLCFNSWWLLNSFLLNRQASARHFPLACVVWDAAFMAKGRDWGSAGPCLYDASLRPRNWTIFLHTHIILLRPHLSQQNQDSAGQSGWNLEAAMKGRRRKFLMDELINGSHSS